MDIFDAINNRRSIRSFADKRVDRQTIEKLLEAAVQAPSAMNSQPWAFAVIQDALMLEDYSKRTKELLLGSLDRVPQLTKYKAAFENDKFNIFYNAQSLIVIWAKHQSLHAAHDCCLAAQNLMLAAHALGLGTCWIGFAHPFLNQPEIKQELGIPADFEAVAPIIVGYPQITPPTVTKSPPEIVLWK